MARIVGIFESSSAVDAVVEQLQVNNVTELTVLRPDDAQALQDHLRVFIVPEAQAAEYRTRLDNQRWLLFVQVSALALPTVQRILRSGQALDIDLLPEPSAS